MPKELKIVLMVSTALTLLALALVVRTSQNDTTVGPPITQLDSLTTVDQIGQISRLGGEVVKEYAFQNTGQRIMRLGKIVSSCMCTKAKVVVRDKESRWFSMEGPGDRNPPLNYDLGPGESGKVVVNFDPNAHGPRGVGPFERTVQLFFNQPRGVREFKFSGEVI